MRFVGVNNNAIIDKLTVPNLGGGVGLYSLNFLYRSIFFIAHRIDSILLLDWPHPRPLAVPARGYDLTISDVKYKLNVISMRELSTKIIVPIDFGRQIDI